MTRLKICGITSERDAQMCVEAGADLLGFNFYQRSPRYIAPEKARKLVRGLPRRVEAVGVFVNLSTAEILRIARAADLSMIQLHGDEKPQVVNEIAQWYRVIKAFRMRARLSARELARFSQAEYFLLDGFHPELRGGAGARFDWRIARDAAKYGRIILAGGLTAENVASAVKQAQPYCVDVCSGTELTPGKKDARKVKAFARALGR